MEIGSTEGARPQALATLRTEDESSTRASATASQDALMVVHLVLFRLRPDLTEADRDALLRSFESAVRQIPSVIRAAIGPRVTHGAGYEQANTAAYPYAATIEFADLAGLQTYLQHSSHAE